MVEAFATATGKRPDFVCGKPEQSFLDLIVQRYDIINDIMACRICWNHFKEI
jgi:ribonucleotide monophosphatase NagD (HAD superfamily)